jgi:hypothetical protein
MASRSVREAGFGWKIEPDRRPSQKCAAPDHCGLQKGHDNAPAGAGQPAQAAGPAGRSPAAG